MQTIRIVGSRAAARAVAVEAPAARVVEALAARLAAAGVLASRLGPCRQMIRIAGSPIRAPVPAASLAAVHPVNRQAGLQASLLVAVRASLLAAVRASLLAAAAAGASPAPNPLDV